MSQTIADIKKILKNQTKKIKEYHIHEKKVSTDLVKKINEHYFLTKSPSEKMLTDITNMSSDLFLFKVKEVNPYMNLYKEKISEIIRNFFQDDMELKEVAYECDAEKNTSSVYLLINFMGDTDLHFVFLRKEGGFHEIITNFGERNHIDDSPVKFRRACPKKFPSFKKEKLKNKKKELGEMLLLLFTCFHENEKYFLKIEYE